MKPSPPVRPSVRALALAFHTRVVLFGAIWISLFAYAGRPLLIGAAVAGVAPALAWIALAVLAALPLLSWRDRDSSLTNWTGYAILALFSTLLVLVLAGDVVGGLYSLARWTLSGQTWPLLDPRGVALTILAASGALSLVGLAQARCPRIHRVRIPIENLPPELDGYRIVQWSDVHVGPTIRRGFVQALVDRTNALEPDAVAITGDFVDSDSATFAGEVEPIRDLRTRDGVFYVTGNHEYYWNHEAWLQVFEGHGVECLRNEHRVVRDGRIVFAGITDPVGRDAHKQDPDRALAGAPADAVKVLLSHRPQAAPDAQRLGVDLQLSGHTHGGQFFPFNLVIKKFQPLVAGLHRAGKTWVYVNRGTGYWGPPSRLAVGGEITVLELELG
jgi:predicted MPP superfamily phosphohydrolase